MNNRPRWLILVLAVIALLLLSVHAQDDDTGLMNSSTDNQTAYDIDPILQFRPVFVRSLPVQILMTGIVLTLTAVLFIHLLFTGQYHFPLAKTNYLLQIGGTFSLLVSLIATLAVVLSSAANESKQWPYMLSYVAVNLPPDDPLTGSPWTLGERAGWLFMNATTSSLIQITHIHFLTLLYPSRIEAGLIMMLLVPLALVSAVTQLLLINEKIDTVVLAAVRNVCNATLSLLFTASLLLWGLVVNRKHAWRTDGGTFAFGAGACGLALISTALNFLYIPSMEEYLWMPGLIWCVILWQSFFGWWWWAGTGVNVDELDETLRRQEKKKRKRTERRERRREQKEKAKTMLKGVASSLTPRRRASEKSMRSIDNSSRSGTEPTRRGGGGGGGRGGGGGADSDSEHSDLSEHGTRKTDPSTLTTTSSSSQVSTSLTPSTAGARAWAALLRVCSQLRIAHLVAARDQAAEHVERIQAVYARESALLGPEGIIIHGARGAGRITGGGGGARGGSGQAHIRYANNRRGASGGGGNSSHHQGGGGTPILPVHADGKRGFGLLGMLAPHGDERARGGAGLSVQQQQQLAAQGGDAGSVNSHNHNSSSHFDDEAVDLSSPAPAVNADRWRRRRRSSSSTLVATATAAAAPEQQRPAAADVTLQGAQGSMMWWGPLRRWRLRDVETYS